MPAPPNVANVAALAPVFGITGAEVRKLGAAPFQLTEFVPFAGVVGVAGIEGVTLRVTVLTLALAEGPVPDATPV